MKRTHRLICLLIILSTVALPLNAQSKKEKKEAKIKAIRELVDSQKIEIKVNTAYPMTGPSINLTSEYSVVVRNDSVYSYMPYYGVAYNIPYGGGSGLIFSAPITDYQVKYKKNGTANVTFKVHSPDDNLTYFLSIYTSGSVHIYVTPTNRQAISFRGEFVYEKPSQKK